MGLTLPGLLGRIFSAAGNLFQQSTLSGDAFPSYVVFGDGRQYISDGTQDLTGSVAYLEPTTYVRGRGNEIALLLMDGNFGAVRSVFEIQAFGGAPIFAVKNAGGVFLNDNMAQAYSVFGPTNYFSDIYGHVQLGNSSVLRITAGPPGNNLTQIDATGEIFQRGRTGSVGSWTATNATYAAFSTSPVPAPSGIFNVRSWAATGTSTIVATTSTSLTGPYKMYPCPPNTFCAGIIYTQSKTVARSKTLGLAFYNAAGSLIGSASLGTPATDTTTSWTRLNVQAVSPASAAFAALQLTITSPGGAGETHYDTAAGWWDSVTTSQVSAWAPPYTFRQDAFPPAAVTASAVTGNTVTPIVITVPSGHPFLVNDVVTTSGFTLNTAANQVNAVITAVASTSITIAGTGNGATSAGVVQFNFAFDGRYDGAFVGDVWVRSDGPANVVQRFATNAVAGVPSSQNWVNDPRINSQPARVNWYGGNYLQQTGSTDLDYTLPNVSTGLLHNDPTDSVNRGVIATVGSWNLLNNASNAQAFGGVASFTQAVRKKSTGAPYVSKDGLFVFLYGLWDLAMNSSGAGAGGMTQLNATTTGSIAHSLRDMICHARASSILPYTDSHFVNVGPGNLTISANQMCFSGGGPGVPGGAFGWNGSTGGSFTFTIPADFTGGAISFAFLAVAGVFGGTFTFTGTLFSTGGVANPGPLYISSTVPVGSNGRVCQRFKNLTAAHAGLTVIGTVTQLDSTGFVFLDCAYVEGQYPNMVAVCGVPRLVANANYGTLAGAGSYWNGNSGSTGDADVQQMNTALQALVAEFDTACFYVDLDSALQKYGPYFAADGFSMGALGVHAMASQFSAALQNQLPLINFRNINHDFHDATISPVGGPFFKQGPLSVSTGVSRFYADDYYYLSSVRASVNTAPQGASLIVDVFKNGSTIFTTTGNRPTITAGSFTATSAAPPDLLFLQPGDYLTINVVQVGSTAQGQDLTVNVLGRRVPIP